MEFAVAGVVIVLLSSLLLTRPIRGVADNGDFARIMNSSGLYYLSDNPEDRYFGFVNLHYGIGYMLPFGGQYITTELLLVWLAVYICKSLLGTAVFDIRFLAFLYIMILAAALFFLTKSGRRFAGLFALIPALISIIIFCDIGYTSYFNSMYGEPVTLVFLLLMAAIAAVLAASEKPAIWMLAIFCSGAFFFAGAKVQNAPAGLLMALLCISLARLRRDRPWKAITIVSAVLVAIISLTSYLSVSKDIRICNKYQTIFYGILKDSPDPSADLAELGLDPSLSVLAGTNYFMEEYPVDIRTPQFRKMLYDNVGYMDVVAFYLKHPGRFIKKLELAAENGFKLKQGFGNYEKYPGITYKQTTNVFGFWSDFKMKALPHTLPFICLFYAGALSILLHEYRKAADPKRRFFTEFMGTVVLTGMMQFALPILGDGEADLSKHLFLFNVCFDMLFAASLTYLAVKALSALKWLKNRRASAKLQTE